MTLRTATPASTAAAFDAAPQCRIPSQVLSLKYRHDWRETSPIRLTRKRAGGATAPAGRPAARRPGRPSQGPGRCRHAI
eukprot:4736205-Pleurochrysis_carterae.AAC.1